MTMRRVLKRLAILAFLALPVVSAGCGAAPSFLQTDIGPDGTQVAYPHVCEVDLRDLRTNGLIRTLTGGHDALVTAVHYTLDGRRLVSGDKDGKMVFWDVPSGQKIRTLTGHESAIEQLAVRKERPDLASCSNDHLIKLWDLDSGEEVRTLAGHTKAVYYVGFSPDGKWLVSASKDKTVKIWEVASGAELRTLTGHAKAVRVAQFDSSGAILATGSNDGAIKLWTLKTGEELRTLEGASGSVVNLYFSVDDQWVLAYQYVHDSLTKRTATPLGIWNVATGEHVVNDYAQEVRHAPPEWPYRAVVQGIARKEKHLSAPE